MGEAADKVSSLRLFDPFPPKSMGVCEVFKDSFGRFDGKGARSVGTETWLYDIGAEGKMASDIVLVAIEEVGYTSGNGDEFDIRASMIHTVWDGDKLR